MKDMGEYEIMDRSLDSFNDSMFVLQSVIKKKRERSFKSSNETKKKSKIIDCCVEQNSGMNGLIIDIHYVYCSTKSNVIDITTTVKFNNYQSFVSSKP